MSSKLEELATMHQEVVVNIELLKSLRKTTSLFMVALENGLYRNKEACSLFQVILDNNESTKEAIDKYQRHLEKRFNEVSKKEDEHE